MKATRRNGVVVSGSIWLLALVVVSPPSLGAPPSSTDASASDSGPLLDASLLQSLRSALISADRQFLARRFGGDDGSAARCRVEDERWMCHTLRVRTEDWILEAEKWQVARAERRARTLRAKHRDSGRIVTAARGQMSGRALELRELRVAGTDGRCLLANRVALDESSILLTDVRWRASERKRAETSESPIPEIQPVGADDARARRVRYRSGEWTFESLRTTPAGYALPVGPVGRNESTRASGLVPPTITYSGGRVEILQRAFHGPTGLGAALAAAPGGWYGVGPALVGRSNPAWPAIPNERPALLDTQLLYDVESNAVGAAATGALRFGAPRLHVAGSLEETTAEEYWETRRIERDGLLRPWRRSALGLALSGPSHHFQIRAAHWEPSKIPGDPVLDSALDAALAGDDAELHIRFGTELSMGDRILLSADLYHRNLARVERRDEHGSTLVGAATGTLGEPGRLFAQAHLVSVVGSSFASPARSGGTSDGFQAVPVTQLVGALRGGLTLRGDVSETTHLLRPSLFFYRELAGRGINPAASSPHFAPFSRVPQWTLAGLTVEQTIRWPDFELRLPVGTVAQGDGFRPAFTSAPDLFGRLELEWPIVTVKTGIVAPADLDTADVTAALQFELQKWTATAAATTFRPRNTGLLYAEGILPHPPESLRLLEGQREVSTGNSNAPLRPEHLVPHLSLDWDDETNRIETSVFARDSFRRFGATAGWTYRVLRMGWGVGLQGSLVLPEGRWGVSVGLRRSGAARRAPP